MSVTLKYGSLTKDFSEVGIRGFDDCDEIKFLMFQNRILPDGSIYQRIPAYKRVITLDLGIPLLKADRVWLHNFMLSGSKTLTYLGIELSVDLEDISGYADEFWDGCETMRYYVLRLEEKLPSVTIPVEFGTQTALYTSDGEPVYDSDGRQVFVWV
jgi:hypothetical protein